MKNEIWLKRFTLFAVLLACTVVALGAYTRLKDAGLGCPDWPGCYGNLTVPESHTAIQEANEAYPHRPVETEKAWAEMIHRYFASSLGLVIFTMLWLSFKARKQNPDLPIVLPLLLSGLVVFQGLLGMWTVTLGLFPTVVMAHLLGGFSTLCLLFLFLVLLHKRTKAQQRDSSPSSAPNTLLKWGLAGIVILVIQIALGGWTAANYAAAVCTELPLCQPGWQQHVNFSDAFKFWGHGVEDYEFATHLGTDAKITIHVAHRVGAIITSLYLGGLFLYLLGPALVSTLSKRIALVGLVILLTQIALGVGNIVLKLPLAIAVAHNGVAAILMMTLILLTVNLAQGGNRQ